MSTPDIADFDLDAMMAELDEQTAEIVAASASEPAPAKAAEPEPVIKRTDHRGEEVADEIVIDDDIDMDAVAAAMESTDDLPFEPTQPTKTDELTAEQELDLQEAFDPDAETTVVETPVELTAEEISTAAIALAGVADALEKAVKVEVDPAVELQEPEKDVQPEPEKVAEVEAAPEVEVQDKSIPNFEPKPSEKPQRSEKAMFELTKLKYQPDVEAFNRDIAFTDATLDAAMVSQASLVAYQNERAARAAAQASKLKLKFDSIEALLYEAYRKDFLDKGVKVTEKAIENAVRKDSRWIKAKEAVIEAEMYADIHKGFVFALKDRNDMLIQRGSYRRQEMQGQMRFQESMEHATNPAHNQNVTDTSGHAAAMRALKNARG